MIGRRAAFALAGAATTAIEARVSALPDRRWPRALRTVVVRRVDRP